MILGNLATDFGLRLYLLNKNVLTIGDTRWCHRGAHRPRKWFRANKRLNRCIFDSRTDENFQSTH